MLIVRGAAATATDLACRAVGRREVVRAARFVLLRARLDVRNDLHTNGESSLQRWALDLTHERRVPVLDVGANVGRWSSSMLAASREAGRLGDLDLHAFEPSAYTFARLTEELDGQDVTLHRVALSDRCGSSVLHIMAPAAGTNSLHRLPGVPRDTEEVATTTLDAQAQELAMDWIALVKIDAEGHDLSVLRGAQTLLAQQRISIVQFEYNRCWIYARSFLRDAFEMLEPLGYRIGKLTPRGVEFYPRWHPDLETFVQSNYVACTPGVAESMPSVPWWGRENDK
jgi:FkbM family methyltransferase